MLNDISHLVAHSSNMYSCSKATHVQTVIQLYYSYTQVSLINSYMHFWNFSLISFLLHCLKVKILLFPSCVLDSILAVIFCVKILFLVLYNSSYNPSFKTFITSYMYILHINTQVYQVHTYLCMYIH